MRYTGILASAALILATVAPAQPPAQAPAAPPQSAAKAPAAEEPLDIYQIDLVPSGTGFALTKPVLEGDVYVFKVWPDRSTVRLPKAKVKQIVPRTQAVNTEVLYKIDIAPSGQMYSRDEPTLKGATYQFHSWKGNTLVALKKSDVKTITRLSGLDAFKVHLEQLGAKRIGDLPMQGGGSVSVVGTSPGAQHPAAAAEPMQSQTPYNWIYQGVPGVTDAWAPPSAVVSAPGDVPKAPEPH